MELEDRLELIQTAQDLVREAKDMVDEAVRGANIRSNYEAYGKYGFRQLLGEGNPYDGCLDDLQDELDNEFGEEEE